GHSNHASASPLQSAASGVYTDPDGHKYMKSQVTIIGSNADSNANPYCPSDPLASQTPVQSPAPAAPVSEPTSSAPINTPHIRHPHVHACVCGKHLHICP